MAVPCTVVESGGVPVTESAHGSPFTPTINAFPVTIVANGGIPVVFVDVDGTLMPGGGAAVFSPADLFSSSEKGAWYDPSDLSTMFQDTAGATPVTTAGQSVARINDKSGNGLHLTQATAGSRPTYQTSAGLHWLAFDGSDDGMVTSANLDLSSVSKASVIAGVRKVSGATVGMIAELSSNAGSNGGFALTANGWWSASAASYGAASRNASGATYAAGDSTASFATPITNVLAMASDLSAATIAATTALRINAVAQTLTFSSTAGPLGGVLGSAPLYVGCRGGSSLPFSGRLYGLILRGAASTAGEIAAAETWMNTKTGAF